MVAKTPTGEATVVPISECANSGFSRELMGSVVVDCNTNNLSVAPWGYIVSKSLLNSVTLQSAAQCGNLQWLRGGFSTENFDHKAIYRVTFDTICEFDSRHIDCVPG